MIKQRQFKGFLTELSLFFNGKNQECCRSENGDLELKQFTYLT